MSNKADTVSSGPDSTYVEKPDEGQLQQASDAGLIEHDHAAHPRATDLLQDASRKVQGMMASMVDPGFLASSGHPGGQSSSTTMMQSTIVNPDGTVSTGIAGDPSGDARTATSYDATTNTITTATVDPASGSITTTSTTVPRAPAGPRHGERAIEAGEQA